MTETMTMTDALEGLLTKIHEDYISFNSGLSSRAPEREPQRQKMNAEFREGLKYKIGSKYIRIISGNSVWGFVVNTTNDKQFRYGDILKAASWATPSRNKARGNVFEPPLRVSWTGPNYLR
jgi:hypothetical protein